MIAGEFKTAIRFKSKMATHLEHNNQSSNRDHRKVIKPC